MAKAVVRLRAGHPDDADAIAEIWHLGWRDGHLGHVPDDLLPLRTLATFRQRAPKRIADTTVATVAGSGGAIRGATDEVAGFVMVVDDEVEQVYVSSAHRGSGVARALLAEAERQVAEGGYEAAWLAVVAGNRRARAFYEREGWVDEGPVDYVAGTASGDQVVVRSHRYAKPV